MRLNGVAGVVDVRVWWTDDLAGDIARMQNPTPRDAKRRPYLLPKLPGERMGHVEAFIFEGNHRIRAAAELGLEVPVRVTYYGHAEKVVDLLKPRGRAARRTGPDRIVEIPVGKADEIRFAYGITTAGDALFAAYYCLSDVFDEDDAVPTRPDEPALYVSDIYIPDSRRGAGKAARMVRAAERWAYQQGARRSYLCATPYGSTDAVGFWSHMGYHVDVRVWDSAVMYKDLAPPAGRTARRGRASRNALGPATWRGELLGAWKHDDPFANRIQAELERAPLATVITNGGVSYKKIRRRFPLLGPAALAVNEHVTHTGFRLVGARRSPYSYGGMIYMLREHGGDWTMRAPSVRATAREAARVERGRSNAVRRVAFDFDNTLTIEGDAGYLGPNPAMIRTLRRHVAQGDEVWIVTARTRRGLDRAMSKHYTTRGGFPLVHAFVRDQQLPVTNILFIGNIGKGPTLRRNGIALFYDDQEGQRQSAESEGVEAHPPVYP
jgi:GNAT superfamily N-acetyltransferase